MPLLLGIGFPTLIRAANPLRSKYSSVANRASTALEQPLVASISGVSEFETLLYKSTRTLEKKSTGQVTRKYMPSRMP